MPPAPDSDTRLDWLCARHPRNAAAQELIERTISGEWLLAISPLTLANIFYIYRKHAGTQKALAALHTMRRMGIIPSLDAGHVQSPSTVNDRILNTNSKSPVPKASRASPPSSPATFPTTRTAKFPP